MPVPAPVKSTTQTLSMPEVHPLQCLQQGVQVSVQVLGAIVIVTTLVLHIRVQASLKAQ